MSFSVYLITNLINKKLYIGITQIPIIERFEQHLKEARNGSDRHLCRATRKYGESNFTIELLDDTMSTIEEMKERERYYIEKYDTFSPNKKGYNMTLGGDGSWGRVCKQETRDKISISNKGIKKWIGKTHPATGVPQSVESNMKRSKTQKGRALSDETKERIRLFWTCHDRKTGENHWSFGKTHTDESKQKMSDNSWMKTEEGKLWAKERGNKIKGENNPMFGYNWSKEQLLMLSGKTKGGNNPRAKPTVIADTNGCIISIHSFGKEIIGFKGITRKQLENRIKNKKDYKGYYFVIISKGDYLSLMTMNYVGLNLSQQLN